MPEYLSPGVYVEEIDTGTKPIEGVSTSTVGFLGIAERGPKEPTFIASYPEFARTFGGHAHYEMGGNSETAYLAYAVEGFFQNGGKRCFIVRAIAPGATQASAQLDGKVAVTALGEGTWANKHVFLKVEPAKQSSASVPLFKLSVFYFDSTVKIADTPLDPTDPANLFSRDPDVRAELKSPTIVESYDNLSPVPGASNFYVKVINEQSTLIRTAKIGDGVPAAAGTSQGRLDTPLDGGQPGTDLTLESFTGNPLAEPGQKVGLSSLEDIEEISVLCCPDEAAVDGITQALVIQCETLRDRFAILQSVETPPPIQNHRPPIDTKYAAYYYPWLEVYDSASKLPVPIPPGGHVAGIYARSDNERGVHKAPANEPVLGLFADPNNPASGLQVLVSKAQQDLLNPVGVNVIRYFKGRGPLVWGARTASTDPDWKYVNVRRLFIYIAKSIERGTQWVVFEPNDEELWLRVTGVISDFLTGLWKDEMLMGATREQAFFVRCDRSTMSEADIANGKLIVQIGIAPVRPAEFVIFRIGQWAGGSDLAEGA